MRQSQKKKKKKEEGSSTLTGGSWTSVIKEYSKKEGCSEIDFQEPPLISVGFSSNFSSQFASRCLRKLGIWDQGVLRSELIGEFEATPMLSRPGSTTLFKVHFHPSFLLWLPPKTWPVSGFQSVWSNCFYSRKEKSPKRGCCQSISSIQEVTLWLRCFQELTASVLKLF